MATSAARAEATDTPITVTWNRNTYRLIPSSDWDMSVLEAMEDGKITHILRGILAGDGYARLAAAKPKVSELREFFEKVQKALGISGN